MNYLTTEQLCERLKLSRNTVYKMYRLRGFPAIKVGNKFITEEEKLDSFLSKNFNSCLNV